MKLVTAWYRKSWWLNLLLPVSLLFRLLVWLRRAYWRKAMVVPAVTVPVIVVGNITVGGTGKTPLVIALGKLLQEQGLRPAVISRGYGGSYTQKPTFVKADSTSQLVGDEPLLIACNLQCPVVIDSDRCRARDALLAQGECDVIISDDGLQHYALHRDVEIVVIDGQRGLGNGYCLPAGPLREPPGRLREVDFIVVNEGDSSQWLHHNENSSTMHLRAENWVNLQSGQRVAPPELVKQVNDHEVHAIAGTGNPQRFFSSLEKLGVNAVCHPFPDHYKYNAEDLLFTKNAIVVMTEKDAVKCQAFAQDNYWYLAVTAELDKGFKEAFKEAFKVGFIESFKSSLRNTVKHPSHQDAERESTHGS